MEQTEIEKLLGSGIFPGQRVKPQLNETHISWVILTTKYAYKIKKPLCYSFLDFSTLEKRKYYCEREVELNKRLAGKMYVKVLPIFNNKGYFSFNQEDGRLIDYAVLMNRMNRAKEMDRLLEKDRVSPAAVKKLAKLVAVFHRSATVINTKFDPGDPKQKFNDLQTVQEFVSKHISHTLTGTIPKAIEKSTRFLDNHKTYLEERSLRGDVRDVHGDLHSGNIFLSKEPVIFDCIEFNDSLRQIDILDEVAFFCMDLEAFHRPDLSKVFYENYMQYSGIKETRESKQLFNYYKSYRANVRAKISALNALQADDDQEQYLKNKQNTEKYLKLLKSYLPEF
jgi:aminoglycoside phosphotransferase family enzyme